LRDAIDLNRVGLMNTTPSKQSLATEPPPVEYLARIKPESKRETQIVAGSTFKKSKGWHGPITDLDLVETLSHIPENDLNPSKSPLVFEIRTVAEAHAIAEAEERAKAVVAVGTITNPRPPPTPLKPVPRERGRR
jgi:hypothetical protein